MKFRDKVILSLIAGILSLSLCSAPMWWGVLFSPITKEMTTSSLEADSDGWFRWEAGGIVLRFKTLDLLFSFFQ